MQIKKARRIENRAPRAIQKPVYDQLVPVLEDGIRRLNSIKHLLSHNCRIINFVVSLVGGEQERGTYNRPARKCLHFSAKNGEVIQNFSGHKIEAFSISRAALQSA